MTTAALNGIACTRARVQWPSVGRWWADLDLAPVFPGGVSAPAVGDAVTLTLADLTFVGTIASGGVFDGRAAYRVVAGRGGWSRTLPRRGYQNDLGVSVATLIADLAEGAGELTPVGAAALGRVSPHYDRIERPAYQTLHALAPRAWWTGADGVVRIGPPPETTYSGRATETAHDPRSGITRLAAIDALAGLMPGAVIQGRAPACDVELLAEGAAGLSIVVYHAASARSRRVQALAEIIDAIDPFRAYRACYEYRIVGQTGERLDLQPVRTATGMSDLARVPVRPGMAGLKAAHLSGALCLVAFVDADPSRPCVVAFDDADSPGFVPNMLTVANGAAPVTRDDHLQAALTQIDTAIAAGFTAIGVDTGAGLAAYNLALGMWPPATAAAKLESD